MLPHLYRICSLLLCLACCLPLPSLHAQRPPSEQQAAAAVALLQAGEQRGEAVYGLSVRDIGSETPIAEYRAHQPFIPASVTKIFSTATALITLGGDYQFPTEIGYRGHITPDSILQGDLILVGHGDPSVDSKHYKNRIGLLYKEVLRAVKETGIKKISGRIIADASAYCDEGYPDAWPGEDWGKRYAPAVYGINIADNNMLVGISASDVARGCSAPTYLSPAISGNEWRLNLRLVRKGNRLSVSTDRGHASVRTLSGHLARGGKQRQVIACDLNNPAEAAAQQLKAYLSDAGLDLSDCTARSYYAGSAPRITHLIGIYLSPKLSDLIHTCNVHSVNLYAEAVLRSICNQWGMYAADCASTEQALEHLHRYWRSALDLPSSEIQLYDGSGLSRQSRLSPHALTAALRHIYLLPPELSDPFILSLPRVGVEGTVRKLMPATDVAAYFKSGSLRGVQNYSGYVSYSGSTYCVTILANQVKKRYSVRKTMTDVLRTLFPAQDLLDELHTLPVTSEEEED